MLTGLEFFGATAGNPAADGVKIPLADLSNGLTSSELSTGTSIQKECKFLYAFLEKVNTVLSPTNFEKLGIGLTRDTSDAGAGLVNFDFTLTAQYFESLNGNPVPLPIPTTGSNSGVGDFTFTSIFPNAAKVTTADDVDDAIVIPTGSLTAYGSPTQTNLNLGLDSRAYLMALYRALASESTLRVTNTPSAIIASAVSTASIVTLAAAATDATNPTTGIQANFIPYKGKVTQNLFSISIQTQLTPSNMTYEVYIL